MVITILGTQMPIEGIITDLVGTDPTMFITHTGTKPIVTSPITDLTGPRAIAIHILFPLISFIGILG